MDHLLQIAKAYYHASSSEFQAGVQELFQVLDSDGDGLIDKDEFICVMTQDSTDEERDVERCRNFFNELDADGSDTLDFWEVMTLLYIYKSRRPFCDVCEKFIPGTYFTCVECYADPDTQFDLCICCYEKRRSSGHNHRGKPAQFLDNYTLLDAKRSSGLNTNTNVNNTSHTSASTHVGSSVPVSHPNTTSSNNTAIVPAANKYEKWKVALQALQIAITVGSCTIM